MNTTGNENTAIGDQALYSNTTGGQNTAIGNRVLYSNTSGNANTASGEFALYSNTTGIFNTATGFMSLETNTTGYDNTANGEFALYSNTTGGNNIAIGMDALGDNTTGYSNSANGVEALYSMNTGWGNNALGYQALYSDVYGHNNVGIGYQAGYNLTGSNNVDINNQGVSGESNTIRIGDAQSRTYIAGISGKPASGGVQVYINSDGQLGTLTSSRRFKDDITTIGTDGDKLLQLRAVSFHYKQAADDGTKPLQYGLIAEEVAKVYPELVQYDKEGKPFTVYYNLLTPLMLSELQKEHATSVLQQAKLLTQQTQLTDVQKVATQQQVKIKDQEQQLASLNQQLTSQHAEVVALLQQQKQQVAEMTAMQQKLTQLDDLMQAKNANNAPAERVALVPSH